MARIALVETATGRVTNVIELEPESANWPTPAGHHLQVSEVAGPGDTWDGVKFVKPPEPLPSAPDPDIATWASATAFPELKALIGRRLGLTV